MGAFSHAQFAQFRRLTGQLSSVSGDVSSVAGDVAAVASDVNSLTGEVMGVKNQAAATQQDLIDLLASISNLVVPTGVVECFAMATAPTGWLLCDGAAVSRTDNADLYAAIGDTYGAGDGTTTFNLPNLKGRVISGVDASVTAFDTLGKTGGAATHTLIVPEIPTHTHGLAALGGDVGTFGGATPNIGAVIVANKSGYTITSTGGGLAHNNLQPYITMYYCIKT